jgi:hypothetical protein
VLAFGLKDYFHETYSWDEIATSWKDIRQIKVDFIIDDDEYHQEAATKTLRTGLQTPSSKVLGECKYHETRWVRFSTDAALFLVGICQCSHVYVPINRPLWYRYTLPTQNWPQGQCH